MRVLHLGKFYPPVAGGMETHLRALCEGIAGAVDVEVVVSNVDRTHVRERIEGVSVTRLGRLAEIAGVSLCPRLPSVIRRSRADIVHLHHPNPVANAAYLASRYTGPLIVTYHSDIVRQRVLGRAIQPVIRAILARAERIICTSPNYIESSETLADFRAKCVVLPFSTDLGGLDATAEEVAAVRAQFSGPLFLTVGRLVPYKGIDVLVRAMVDAPGRLLVVGTGPERARLESIAREIGVSERVHFLGHVARLGPLYRAADAFVLASVSRNEAFGLVQLEAMSCGRPVINTSLATGVPFVSVNELTGLTVPPGDAQKLAMAMRRLSEDSDLRRRLGQAAAERVRTSFGTRQMCEQTLQLYRAVLAGNRAGR